MQDCQGFTGVAASSASTLLAVLQCEAQAAFYGNCGRGIWKDRGDDKDGGVKTNDANDCT